jgi:hypothetical protein
MKFSTTGHLGCLAALVMSGGIASAEPLAPAKEPAADYDLPAQELAVTLRLIARTSGEDILFASDLVRGRTAHAVRGHPRVSTLAWPRSVSSSCSYLSVIFHFSFLLASWP